MYQLAIVPKVKKSIEFPEADALFVNLAPIHDVLPHIHALTQHYKHSTCMLVWETEEVPEILIRWASMFKHILAPSLYCINIFNLLRYIIPCATFYFPYIYNHIDL